MSIRTLTEKLARIVTPPPAGVVVASEFAQGGQIVVDICIVTNCAFVGGNASSTIAELQAFSDAGLRCIIVHCPVKRSIWKRNWVAERFIPFLAKVVPSHAVDRIECNALIVRGPRMAMTRTFSRFAPRVKASRALYIVNNSAWSENGKPLFDWSALHERVAQIGIPRSQIFPISPLVREEAKRSIDSYSGPELLAPYDWPPAFDTNEFTCPPDKLFRHPIVIGRHGRDHEGKWLEDPTELLQSYPDAADIAVNILGGAEVPRRRLGSLPGNWTVLPFGSSGVSNYLSQIDVFVYFPSRKRDEAFGRTVIEAILANKPVILPHSFASTFGQLAFYCEPSEVATIVRRLADDSIGRIGFVSAARKEAVVRYGAHALKQRLADPVHGASYTPALDDHAEAFRQHVMRPLEAEQNSIHRV